MNVLFLTLLSFNSILERNLYTDLLREFVKNGHQVYAISPVERRQKQETHLVKEENAAILRLQIGNTQKSNIIEKGISTVMLEPTFQKAIKQYFSDVKFELVLYSTPPITLVSAIEYVRKRDGAKTYLLLKDIFPQNAVDIDMMSTRGLKSLLYKHFRKKEKKLYRISDCIGCMSQANVDYVIKHNPEIDARKVEVCPNSIDPVDMRLTSSERDAMRTKYGIPLDKKVFVYGGNLGKPQGIDFLIQCLDAEKGNHDAYFLIVGDGTEYGKLDSFFQKSQPENMKLMKRLPKADYDRMVAACDVGMIFLDHRFTIPNFPSRLLSYMQTRLPVIAVTDTNTDIGQTIVDGNFGWRCESNHVEDVKRVIEEILKEDLRELGNHSWDYMKTHYSVDLAYESIMALFTRRY